MKLKERLWETDLFLLAGLLCGVIKACCGMSRNLQCPELLDTLLNLGMCGCYGIHVLLQKPSVKRLVCYAAAAAAALYSARLSGDMNGMICLLTCMALADCDFDRAVRWLLKCSFACFLVILGHGLVRAALYGPLDNITMEYHYGQMVYHLGYLHKNTLAMHAMSMAVMWFWLNWQRIQPVHLGLFFLGGLGLLVFSQCKTVFLIVLAALAMLVLVRWRPQPGQKLLRAAALAAVPGMFALTVLLMWLCARGNPLAITVSNLLTGRIQGGLEALRAYGLTFWGHPGWYLDSIDGIKVFDNVFIHGMTNIGMAWPLAYSLGFSMLAWKERDIRVHFAIVVWALYAMTEFPITNGFLFFPPLLLSLLIKRR